LPLDLGPPLQGKEYDPPYSNKLSAKSKKIVPESTYRSVVLMFTFLQNLNLRKEMLKNKYNYFRNSQG
jgi:hypothetical protein